MPFLHLIHRGDCLHMINSSPVRKLHKFLFRGPGTLKCDIDIGFTLINVATSLKFRKISFELGVWTMLKILIQ